MNLLDLRHRLSLAFSTGATSSPGSEISPWWAVGAAGVVVGAVVLSRPSRQESADENSTLSTRAAYNRERAYPRAQRELVPTQSYDDGAGHVSASYVSREGIEVRGVGASKEAAAADAFQLYRGLRARGLPTDVKYIGRGIRGRIDLKLQTPGSFMACGNTLDDAFEALKTERQLVAEGNTKDKMRSKLARKFPKR